MATGALDANGIWQYGEDDSETTFSALLNKLASSTSTQIASNKTAGRVLQTVSANYQTSVSTTSTSYVTSNLTVTITPKYSTSKILVMASNNIDAAYYGISTIFRNSTDLDNRIHTTAGAFSVNLMSYDSPATTSAVTYSYRIRSLNGQIVYAQSNGCKANITVMEISA